ncbi:MAG: hypothetical protein AB8F74_06380 [Saprospiraceae bacterium]
MNPKDNIEKFFRKRLQGKAVEEEVWNVPSDDLWNTAKVHFPKKEKKRRPFFWFFLGGGTAVLLTSILFYVFSLGTNNAAQVVHKEIIKNESPTYNFNSKDVATRSIISEERITNNNLELPKEELTKSNLSIANHSDLLNNASYIEPPKLSNKVNSIKNTSTSVSEFLLENLKTKPVIKANELIKSKNNKLEIKSNELTIDNNNILVLSNFPTLSLTLKEEEKDAAEKMIIHPAKQWRNRPRWEIGISHSPFVINPKWVVEDGDLEEGEEYNLGIKYRNINIPVMRRFDRRFSLSSGISLAQLKLDFNFSTEEEYIMSNSEADIRELIRESSTTGTVTIDDESSDVSVVFRPDANLMNGDTITVKGFVPIDLRLIQIPVLFNYHFGKRRWEGIIHAGAGLDYFHGTIKDVNIEVYKDEDLVSEPLNFESINDSEFGFSLYLGAGVKYHITNRFNLGFSTKLDFTELLLSRHEIGIYYGF